MLVRHCPRGRDPAQTTLSPLTLPSLSLTSGQSEPGLHPLLLIRHCQKQRLLKHPVWKAISERKRVIHPCGDLGPKSFSRNRVLSGKVQLDPKEQSVGRSAQIPCRPFHPIIALDPSQRGCPVSSTCPPSLTPLMAIVELAFSQIRSAPSPRRSCTVCIFGIAPNRAAWGVGVWGHPGKSSCGSLPHTLETQTLRTQSSQRSRTQGPTSVRTPHTHHCPQPRIHLTRQLRHRPL